MTPYEALDKIRDLWTWSQGEHPPPDIVEAIQILGQSLAENTRLRAALAHSDQPCVYCSLPADKWAECSRGFPGCPRGDDACGCPELGAAMYLHDIQLVWRRDRLSPFLHELQDELEGGYAASHFLNPGLPDKIRPLLERLDALIPEMPIE